MEGRFEPKNIFKLKQVKEYVYIAFFLLISSFFVVFVIRPNLRQIFLAKKKVNDLRLVRDDYEKVINRIIEFQSNYEQFRGDFYLIDYAVPQSPFINKILVDLNDEVKKNKLRAEEIIINDVDLLKEQMEDPESIKISLKIVGDFNDIKTFLKRLTQQRRLKEIESFYIKKSKEVVSTESGQLTVDLVVNAFYL